ncbi:MAG: S-layer homology domain-containing protein, partial [Sedimentibacter sp.]
MKNKLLSWLLIFLMVFSMLPKDASANVDNNTHYFEDMPNDWSTAALRKAVNNGLLKGCILEGKTLINADASLKRAEMAAIVNRAFGAVKNAELYGVADVQSSTWYADDMAKAIMMGTFIKDTKMRPESNITRQEAFAVLARAFKISSDALKYNALENYFDKDDIAEWAKENLNAMIEAGYVQGYNFKLNPNANISRAEFAAVMDNLVKEYIDMAGVVTDVSSGNVLIRVPGVTLKDLTVKGDLIIADGVGNGEVTLDNVNVEGRTIVRGGGEDSIIIKGNSNLGKTIVCKVDGRVRIVVEGEADVDVVYVDDGSDDVLVEGVIGTLEVAGDYITAVATKAILSNAIVSGDNSVIILREDSTMREGKISGTDSQIIVEKSAAVDRIIVEGLNAKIEGNGDVKNVKVKGGSGNASITTPNTKIETEKGAEGVTAAGGTPVKGGTSVTNNSRATGIVTTRTSGSSGTTVMPADKNITSLATLTDINVANGTVLSSAGLPGTIEVTLDDSSKQNLTVTWDDGTPVYNKDAAGEYVFAGTLTLPANVT